MHRSESPQRRQRDAGLTLIEIIISVVLMGLVVSTVLVATLTATRASSTNRSAAQVESTLVNAVDRVNRAPFDECSFTRFARAAALSQDWRADQVTVTNAYLDRASWTWQTGPAGSEACPAAGHRPQLVKRVVISVTSPDTNLTRSIEVVKSDV